MNPEASIGISPNIDAGHPLMDSLRNAAIVIPDKRIMTPDQALRNLGIQIGDEPIEATTEGEEVENPQILVPAPEAPPLPLVEVNQPPRILFDPNSRSAQELIHPAILTEIGYKRQRLTAESPKDELFRLYGRVFNADNRVFQFNIDIDRAISTIVFGRTDSNVSINPDTLQFNQIGIDLDKLSASNSSRLIRHRDGSNEGNISGMDEIRSAIIRAFIKMDTRVTRNPQLGEYLQRFYDPNIDPATVISYGFGVMANGQALALFDKFDNTVTDMIGCERNNTRPMVFVYVQDSLDTTKYRALLANNRELSIQDMLTLRREGNVLELATRLAVQSRSALGQSIGDRNDPIVRDELIRDGLQKIIPALGQPAFTPSQIEPFFPSVRTLRVPDKLLCTLA